MLVMKGRLVLALGIEELILNCERLPVMRFLPVIARIAAASVQLDALHADPAYRLIVATARAFNATLVTKDKRLLACDNARTAW